MIKEDPRLRSIIQEGDADATIAVAEDLGKQLAGSLSGEGLGKTAVRNIFGMVRQIEAAGDPDPVLKRRVTLLIPKLVYAEARESKLAPLTQQLTHAIRHIRDEECRSDFRNLVQLFEAIVAFHYSESQAARQQGGRR